MYPLRIVELHTHTAHLTFRARNILKNNLFQKYFSAFSQLKKGRRSTSLPSFKSQKSLKNNHASTSSCDRKMIYRKTENQSIRRLALPSKRISTTRSLSEAEVRNIKDEKTKQ